MPDTSLCGDNLHREELGGGGVTYVFATTTSGNNV